MITEDLEIEQEETEELSIHDSIAAASAELQAEEAAEDVQAETEGESAAVEAAEKGQARSADGKFAKKDTAEAAPTEAAPAEDQGQADKQASVTEGAPASWDEQGKALFEKAPPELQNYIRQRETQMHEGVAKLKTQYEAKSNFADEMWAEIAPYQQMIQAEGGTPAAAIKDLLGMAALIRRGTPEQKRQLLLDTARQFQVDLGISQPDDQGSAIDPTVAALQRDIGELKNTFAQREQMTAEQQRQSLMTEIDQFKADKPHFDAVHETMGKLIGAGLATGLEDAYEQAVRLDPAISQTLQAEQAAKAEAEKVEAARLKAQQARNASGSVTGAPGNAGNGTNRTPANSVREELERSLNELRA